MIRVDTSLAALPVCVCVLDLKCYLRQTICHTLHYLLLSKETTIYRTSGIRCGILQYFQLLAGTRFLFYDPRAYQDRDWDWDRDRDWEEKGTFGVTLEIYDILCMSSSDCLNDLAHASLPC